MFTLRNFESKTLSWWFDQRENIDFKPSYQRKGRLWSTKDKSYLIDSILNGFDMPKIYVADFTFFSSNLNENRKPYSVVDGKQRFEAMFDFFDGEITLDKAFVYLEDQNLKLGGLSYSDLKAKFPKIASKFENFNLSVISIITDSEAMINEMFIRLNKSKPLTGAELRNAMKGDVPKYIRSIISQRFFEENVSFSTQRGQDSNVAAKLLLLEFRGKFVDTKKIHLDRLVDDIVAAESSSLENEYKVIERVLGYMNKSFIKRDPLLKSSGLIPVYYWFYRSHGSQKNNPIRNFLVQFEQKRNANKKAERKSADFLNFDIFTKSLNDQGSLQGAYNILESKWIQWNEFGDL